MSQFMKAERPELDTTVYFISDSLGHTVELTPHEAYDLLAWLYDQRAELHTLTHPEVTEQSIPVWLRNLPDWARDEGDTPQSSQKNADRGETEQPSA